jgi:hypothetical protein
MIWKIIKIETIFFNVRFDGSDPKLERNRPSAAIGLFIPEKRINPFFK